MKINLFLPLAAIILFVGPVSWTMAGHEYHGCGMSMSDMSEMDINQDGLITFDEFKKPQTERLRSAFNMLDTNNDEVINPEEWEEFLKVHGYDKKSEG